MQNTSVKGDHDAKERRIDGRIISSDVKSLHEISVIERKEAIQVVRYLTLFEFKSMVEWVNPILGKKGEKRCQQS